MEKLKIELAAIHIKMRDVINDELELKENEAVMKVKKNPKYFYTYAKKFLKGRSGIKTFNRQKQRPCF